MYRLAIISFLLLITIISSTFRQDDDILILDDENFNETIPHFPLLLINFYKPWNNACKAFEPEFTKLAVLLKEKGSSAKLGKVDVSEEGELDQMYSTNDNNYPLIKLFRDKETFDYMGQKTAENLAMWVSRKSGPTALIVHSVEAVEKAFVNESVLFVGLFKSVKSAVAREFFRVADQHIDVAFVASTDIHLKSHYGVSGDTVIALKKFDEGRTDLTDAQVKQMETFVLDNRLPLVVNFHTVGHNLFQSHMKTMAFLFIDSQTSDHVLAVFNQTAPGFKGKTQFVVVDASHNESNFLINYMSVANMSWPQLRVNSFTRPVGKFKVTTVNMTVDTLTAAITSITKGYVKPYFKSQQVSEQWDSGAVKKLVGNNFHRVTKDPSKHVFVKIYLPTCHHCQALAPTWQKLAERYSGRQDVVIGEMDGGENDVNIRQLHSKAYPTMLFYPKGKREVIEYKGERSLEALVTFVESGGRMQRPFVFPKTEL